MRFTYQSHNIKSLNETSLGRDLTAVSNHIMGSYLLMVNNIYLWFYFKFKFVLFHIQGLLGGKLQVESDDNRLKHDLKM